MTYVPQHRDQLVAAAHLQQHAAAGSRPPRRPAPARWPRRTAPAIAAIIAVCIPAAVAAALVIGHSTPLYLWTPGSPPPAVDTTPAPNAGRPPAPELTRAFSVLGRPQVRGDALPAGRTTNAPAYYADQIHHVASTVALGGVAKPAPAEVYIAGGVDDRVCLIVLPPSSAGSGPAGVCQSASMAAEGKTFLTMERNGGADVDVFGVVPDGVRTVKLTLADGRVSELPVIDNVYSATVPAPMRELTFTGPQGTVRISAGP
jgi:hypothetical protein